MKARELLSSEDKWCQDHAALNKDGLSTNHFGDDAVKWCLLGAVYKCYEHDDVGRADAMLKLNNALPNGVSVFNDTHSYDDVKALLDHLDI